MKSTLKKLSQGLLVVPAFALTLGLFAPVATVSAVGTPQEAAQSAQAQNTPGSLFDGGDSVFQIIVNVLLFIIAAIAVVMLIIGGIRYVVSGGDQSAVTSAKNTILYAIIGIIVAILAYAAVNFVLDEFLV